MKKITMLQNETVDLVIIIVISIIEKKLTLKEIIKTKIQ